MKRKENARFLPGGGLWYAGAVFLFVLLALCIGHPVQAKAASYQTARIYSRSYTKKERTANGVTFESVYAERTLYATKNGKKSEVYKAAQGYYISGIVLTNGKYVYFIVTEENGKKSNVYQSTITGKNRKKIAVIGSGYPDIAGYYGKKIYYIDGSSDGALRSLNVSTGKKELVYGSNSDNSSAHVTKASISQNGKYFCFATWKAIYIYNARSGKLKKLGQSDMNLTIEGVSVIYDASAGYVYYVEGYTKSITADELVLVATVKRCRPDGSQKETLLKDIELEEVTKLTSKSITYIDSATGKTKTKKY